MTVAGTIEIEAHAPAFLSLLTFARWRTLSIELDGERGRSRWGTVQFVAAPGEHRVRVGLGSKKKVEVIVQVVANETIRLRYTPGLGNYDPGTLEIVHMPTARLVR